MINSQMDWGLGAPDLGLHLGISLAGADTVDGWHRLLRWVDLAEELGLHSVWMPEAHFVRGGVASPLVILAAFAARTRRLRLATTSLLLPIHDASVMARDVATLDHLSGGRVILGLGRGFRKKLFEAFGIEASQKRDLFDEGLDRMLQLWRGEGEVNAPGEPPATSGTGRLPRQLDPSCVPSQRPHPPLAVAAFGRKGLAQAARRGLPYLASPIESFELIADNLSFHSDNLPSNIRADDLVVPIMRTVFVSRDPSILARVKSGLEGEVTAPRGKLPKSLALALAAPLESRVIVGSPESVTEQLARYREELSMNLLIVRPNIAGVGTLEQEKSLRLICTEVLPNLRTSH